MNQISVKNSLGLRLVLIALISLALLIPAIMIQVLIKERKERRDTAVKETFSKWGETQILAGPIFALPFKEYVRKENNTEMMSTKYLYILPDDLHITGTINPEVRYRGIYELVVYNVLLQFEGKFLSEEIEQLDIAASDIMWQDAFLALGISDMKGIKDLIKIKWNDEELITNPGIKTKDILSSGISAQIPGISDSKNYYFSFNLNINGSDGLFFTPCGKETSVKLSSYWTNPSFSGDFLPVSRNINDAGFTAQWKILHLNRSYPQVWIGNEYNIKNSEFGVRLLMPVDEYQKTTRTAKYAIMFIALTFLSFFMIDMLARRILHPIHYILIGFALLIFYTLLLSLSEYLTFNSAYLISSLSIILLIAGYTKSILKSHAYTSLILIILLVLYSYFYIILQMQDYALMMGSVALFAILGIVMYVTRKTDWFVVLQTQTTVDKTV